MGNCSARLNHLLYLAIFLAEHRNDQNPKPAAPSVMMAVNKEVAKIAEFSHRRKQLYTFVILTLRYCFSEFASLRTSYLSLPAFGKCTVRLSTNSSTKFILCMLRFFDDSRNICQVTLPFVQPTLRTSKYISYRREVVHTQTGEIT